MRVQFPKWHQYEKPAQQWYYTEFTLKDKSYKKPITLQLCINGSFLVNGSPVGTIPGNIYSHCDFKSFFGSIKFDVLPSCYGARVLVPKKQKNQRIYSFTTVSS